MIWLRLAWRDLWRNTRRSLFALGTILIGTVATVAAAGYMLGTFTAVRESTIRGGLAHLQIAMPEELSGYESRVLEHALSPEQIVPIEHALAAVAGIAFSMPRLAFSGIASSGERSVVALGEGIVPRQERRLSALYVPVVAGAALDAAEHTRYAAVIGREMARLLGVAPGDLVTLLAVSAGGGLNALDVEVVGLLATGTPELDRMRVLVPLETAQELLQTRGVRRLAVVLEETSAVPRIRAELAARLPELAVRTWFELSPFYGQLVQLYSRQAAVLGTVIAAIIVLAVFSAIAMSVMERRRDIGTLRSLGIPAARIRRMFLLEGALLGGLGGTAGSAAAWAILAGVNALRITMPPPPGQTDGYRLFIPFDLRIALLTALAITALALAAAWVASRHVTRQRIVAALHAA